MVGINRLTKHQLDAVEESVLRLGMAKSHEATIIGELESYDPETCEQYLCALSPAYFILNYVKIYDSVEDSWIPFMLWAGQLKALRMFITNNWVVVLKARQLGLTWLALGYALWRMLFRPISVIMMFSRRDNEAKYLLSRERFRGMYKHLPDFLKAEKIDLEASHQFKLSNGSVAYAFPTTAGDGYTASLVIVDEADLVPDLGRLLRSIKPTIDAGNQLFLISRVDKSTPNSEFKRIYKGARAGVNGWASLFLGWFTNPDRDKVWYARQKAEVLDRTGGLDDLYEQYPESDEQALSPSSLDKRVPADWLVECYDEMPVAEVDEEELPVAGLVVYHPPIAGEVYYIGSDCAEGLPTSDNSTSYVINSQGEEVAHLTGLYSPEIHGVETVKIAKWYNRAMIMVENNNHGHAFILAAKNAGSLNLLAKGHIKTKYGWSTSTLGKVIMYDQLAEAVMNQEALIHDYEAYLEIQSIELSTLNAPEGDHDDRSDAFALAICCRIYSRKEEISFHILE